MNNGDDTSQQMAKAIKELQDAAIVTAGIQSRHTTILADHRDWLVSHDKAIAETRQAGKRTDERIAKLVVSIGGLIQAMREQWNKGGERP